MLRTGTIVFRSCVCFYLIERVRSIPHTALDACASSVVSQLILKSLLFLPLPVFISHVPIGVLGSQLARYYILLFMWVLEIKLGKYSTG